MKRGIQLKLKQLGVITVAWLFMGFILTLYDHLLLHTGTSLGPTKEYSFLISAARNMGAGLIGALLGGSFLVFFVNVRYQDRPYAYTVLIVSVSFIFIVAFITIVMGITIVPLRTGKPLSDPVSKVAFWAFITDTYPIKNGLIWSFIVGITQLLLQVNGKFGQGTFWNIIRGRYNTPKEENRIFMFLDLNSSTAIAERLGDEAYHALLKDFFADITEPILNNKGIIYQYVGDEVVVAWDYQGGAENLHSLRCFYDMKLQIQRKKRKYLDRYGLVPSFKAGIHCGRVVAGEVGVMKRDITYSGNVLNTASRILSKCGELEEEVIVSADLLSVVNVARDYTTRPLGALKLKGKKKEVLLTALRPNTLGPVLQSVA